MILEPLRYLRKEITLSTKTKRPKTNRRIVKEISVRIRKRVEKILNRVKAEKTRLGKL
jgi:hypothetical protein